MDSPSDYPRLGAGARTTVVGQGQSVYLRGVRGPGFGLSPHAPAIVPCGHKLCHLHYALDSGCVKVYASPSIFPEHTLPTLPYSRSNCETLDTVSALGCFALAIANASLVICYEYRSSLGPIWSSHSQLESAIA